MTQLPILPILIPLVAGAILFLTGGGGTRIERVS